VVTVLGVLGVLAVLFATAVLVTRSDPLLADAPPDRPDLELPPGPLSPDDVEAVRFSMAPRGYRMDEVDAVLARLAEELAERDRLLLELRDQQ
jgi:DivIVA domain-containing protein